MCDILYIIYYSLFVCGLDLGNKIHCADKITNGPFPHNNYWLRRESFCGKWMHVYDGFEPALLPFWSMTSHHLLHPDVVRSTDSHMEGHLLACEISHSCFGLNMVVTNLNTIDILYCTPCKCQVMTPLNKALEDHRINYRI